MGNRKGQLGRTGWLDDDPLDFAASQQDALDRQPFVLAVSGVLRRAYNPGGSSVFGLIGSWGSGKTSLISMVTQELAVREPGQPSWRVASFNPLGVWRPTITSVGLLR